jgi:hypothetical protein
VTEIERIRQKAQITADREQRPMAILNLNRVGAALYVIRFADSLNTIDRSFVEKVEPRTPQEIEQP